MHPLLEKKRRLALYLAAWIPVVLLVTPIVALAGRAPWQVALALVLPLCAIYAFQCLPAWYLCGSFPLQSSSWLRLSIIMSIAATLSASIWLFVGGGWAMLLSRLPRFISAVDLFHQAYPLLFAAGVLLFFLVAAASYLAIAAEASRKAERQSLEMKILAREAELKALRAQIHPHFLFNSLNSVMALIGTDPAQARRMCLLLSDFLRRSLHTSSAQNIPLSEELSLLEGFLGIERVRFGSRLRVNLAIDEDCMECLVPPLLLQPLVENAVNHGIAHLIEGGEISVRARRHGGLLVIHVTNPCDSCRARTSGRGIGLGTVHDRLAGLYGKEARLDTSEKDGHFSAEIRMPAVLQ